MTNYRLNQTTSETFAAATESKEPVVVLLPVGSVEPHGPHLTLLTDTIISEASAERAAARLEDAGVRPFIAPAVPYGVTDFAAGFKGAVSIDSDILTAYLTAVVAGFIGNDVDHVCLINNHLEPEQFRAVTAVPNAFAPSQCSVACPLSRRWARTLSDEFKRGECHAGRYETAIVLAAEPDGVKRDLQKGLPEVPISLSQQIQHGATTFAEMGMVRAYAGAPALATAREGKELLDKLATMIVTEVSEALASAG